MFRSSLLYLLCLYIISFLVSQAYFMPVHAQSTTLELVEGENLNRESLKYSEATLLKVQLKRNGENLTSEKVTFVLVDLENMQETLLSEVQTDGNGMALSKISFTDGLYPDLTFAAAAAPGKEYQLKALFKGNLDPAHSFCLDGAEPSAALNLHCNSEVSYDFTLLLEQLELSVAAGKTAAIGEDLTLVAQIKDLNGFAPKSGSDVQGSRAVGVAGLNISFFFDLNGDLQPSLDEKIGSAKTNQEGVAKLVFNVQPEIFPAGTFEQGLEVQFGGDAHYDLVSTSGSITFEAGKADALKTLIEIEKTSLLADGVKTTDVIATLRDSSGHVLGLDTPRYKVHFESDLGFFQGKEAKYNALTGRYHQTFQSGDIAGKATVQVYVDDKKGSTAKLELIAEEGCACSTQKSHSAMPVFYLLLFFLMIGRNFLVRSRS